MEETVEILDAAFTSLTQSSGASFLAQKTAISLHLQPTSKQFVDLLKPFLSPLLIGLRPERVKTGASIVKWDGGRIVLDGSAALANAMYVRFERTFERRVTYEEMATTLRSDEIAIFKALDVEEESVA